MRCIIIAAGHQTRFGDSQNKHFLEVDGEPIIKRTVRQLKEHGIEPHVVGKTEQYKFPGAKLFKPEYDHNYTDTEFIETAKARKVFAPCLKAKVQHNHPSWGANQPDATYRKTGAKIERDGQIYVERLRQLTEMYG